MSTLFDVQRLLRFELVVGSLALFVAIVAFLLEPSTIAFFAGVIAAVAWTGIFIQLLVHVD